MVVVVVVALPGSGSGDFAFDFALAVDPAVDFAADSDGQGYLPPVGVYRLFVMRPGLTGLTDLIYSMRYAAGAGACCLTFAVRFLSSESRVFYWFTRTQLLFFLHHPRPTET